MLAVDLSGVTERFTLLLREGEPRALEDLFKLITEMPRDSLASFFGKLFKPAYLPMNGTGQHIAELRFVFSGGANELLTALGTFEADRKNNILAHGLMALILIPLTPAQKALRLTLKTTLLRFFD